MQNVLYQYNLSVKIPEYFFHIFLLYYAVVVCLMMFTGSCTFFYLLKFSLIKYCVRSKKSTFTLHETRRQNNMKTKKAVYDLSAFIFSMNVYSTIKDYH